MSTQRHANSSDLTTQQCTRNTVHKGHTEKAGDHTFHGWCFYDIETTLGFCQAEFSFILKSFVHLTVLFSLQGKIHFLVIFCFWQPLSVQKHPLYSNCWLNLYRWCYKYLLFVYIWGFGFFLFFFCTWFWLVIKKEWLMNFSPFIVIFYFRIAFFVRRISQRIRYRNDPVRHENYNGLPSPKMTFISHETKERVVGRGRGGPLGII